jgi:thiosulfate/3-mercaptopyruvate sulfurtransferase
MITSPNREPHPARYTLLGRLMLAALVTCLPFAQSLRAQAAPAAPSDQLVVSAAWLATHLKDPNLVILHVTLPGDTTGEFAKAHIPGARPVTLADISAGYSPNMDMNRGLMLEMLPPDTLRARLEALGISDRSRVIVYSISDRISPTTRVLYTLAYAGLGKSSAFLNGGLGAWQQDGRPVATGDAAPVKPGVITAAYQPSLVVDAAWVHANAGRPGIVLVDARQRKFWDGSAQDDGPRRGHIPSAQSLPFEELWSSDNYMLPTDSLRAHFRAVGAQPGDTIVAYCHIGQRATAVLLAARLLGYPVRLYDGSFQDWGRRTDLPVDNPAAK